MVRKQRSDTGTIEFTHRDEVVLGWIADQYAMRVDTLCILLGRTESTARQWMRRMSRLEYLKWRVILAGEPTWCWVTKAGMRAIGRHYAAWEPTPSSLPQIHVVNRVRLVYGQVLYASPNGWWTSERAIRYQAESDRRASGASGSVGHIVDGMVRDHNGYCTAIEVELSAKSYQHTFNVMQSVLDASYQRIHYIVSNAARSVVQRAADEITYLQISTPNGAWPTAASPPVLVTPVAQLNTCADWLKRQPPHP